MPHYAVVIDDPDKHHAAAVERQHKFEMTQNPLRGRGTDIEKMLHERMNKKEAERKVGSKRSAGDLHTTADSECPIGLPNCRNCGDPEFFASCQAAGHCPYCGTRHGIAPDSYLAYSGVSLKEVLPKKDDEVWDPKTRNWKKNA